MKLPPVAQEGSLRLIRRLFREAGRDFAGRYAVVAVFGLGIAGTTALAAWMIKAVVDDVFVAQRPDALYVVAGILVANGIVRGICMYGSTVTLGRIGNAIVARMQQRMYDHLLSLGIDFYNRTPPSDLVTRMSHNATATRDVLQMLFTNLGRDLLTVIALVAVMFIQSPVMSLLVLVVGPVAILGIARLVKRVRNVARAQIVSLGMVISDMQQTAQGIRIIKAFGLEPAIRRKMASSIDMVRQRADKIVRYRARTSPLMEVVAGIGIGFVVLWAGYRAIYFDEPPGALLSFLGAAALASDPARRLAAMQIPLEAGLVAVRLMYELLDTAPTMNLNPDGPELSVTDGNVVFDNVVFGYGDAPLLFQGLDFTAEGGKTTALVGPSGAGKSTMISLIERFFDIAGGAIRIDGQDIAAVKLSSLREHIALVSQETILFHDTIRQNIRCGRPDATDAEVEQAARDAMAHDFIVATEAGYDSVIGDGAVQLSGGQRQRIAIARAMLRDARILLLDEATSSLDSESEHQIQIALDRLRQGRTTIVIAHRLSTVLGADKIAVLVNGKIVEQGRHAELIANSQHYARLYRLQFKGEEQAGRSGDPRRKAPTVAAE